MFYFFLLILNNEQCECPQNRLVLAKLSFKLKRLGPPPTVSLLLYFGLQFSLYSMHEYFSRTQMLFLTHTRLQSCF